MGTCGLDESDGVWVYDTSRKVAVEPIQKLEGLPSGHALVWDRTESMLWVAGTDVSPETKNDPVHGRLVGYKYDDNGSDPLSCSADRDYKMRASRQLSEHPDWKEGPHDLVPVPGQRKFLFVTDLDVYEFDLDTRQFGYDIVDTYFKGFATKHPTGQPPTDHSLDDKPPGRLAWGFLVSVTERSSRPGPGVRGW